MVNAAAGDERLIARAADEGVVACAADQRVRSAAAGESGKRTGIVDDLGCVDATGRKDGHAAGVGRYVACEHDDAVDRYRGGRRVGRVDDDVAVRPTANDKLVADGGDVEHAGLEQHAVVGGVRIADERGHARLIGDERAGGRNRVDENL